MLKIAACVFFIFAAALNLQALPGGFWAEVETSTGFPSYHPQSEARLQAWQISRDQAFSAALPAGLSLEGLVDSLFVQKDELFDPSSARETFLHSLAAGYLRSEEILDEHPVYPKDGSRYFYKMKYKAQFQGLDSLLTAAPAFTAQLSQTSIHGPEPLILSATSGQDGYLYVFIFSPEGRVSLLYPDFGNYHAKVKQNTPWNYRMSCALPEGWEQGRCAVCLIFSPDPLLGWDKFSSGPDEPKPEIELGSVSYNLFKYWLSDKNPARRAVIFIQISLFPQD